MIHDVWQRGGNLEQDNCDYEKWLSAFEAAGLDIARYANSDIPHDAPLPWDHIDTGVSKEFLAREDAAADRGETTGDCRFGGCSGCGVRESLTRLFGNSITCPPPAPASGAVAGPSETRHRADRGAALLFTLRKGHEARWLGHLDLLRVIDRAVRMSRIDVVYTQGFNPRPKMSIASALPLGATADADLFTIHVAGPADPEAVRQALNGCLPGGVEMVEGCILPDNVKGPEPASSEFLVGVDLDRCTSRDELMAAVRSLMEESSIPAERESGGRHKKIDIRPGIESLSVCDDALGAMALSMTLPHREFTVKPSEVVEALADRLAGGIEIVSIHRKKLNIRL